MKEFGFVDSFMTMAPAPQPRPYPNRFDQIATFKLTYLRSAPINADLIEVSLLLNDEAQSIMNRG